MSLNPEIDVNLLLRLAPMPSQKIKSIRTKYNMTQMRFSELMGVKFETYRSWEKGVRSPSSPGYALLNIADKHPEIFLENRKEIISGIMKYFKVGKN